MKFDYVISSNIKYYEKTLPLLIRSLKNSGIDNLYIYVGNSDTEYETKYDDFYCKFVSHNSFDYTGVIEYSKENINSDYTFLLHDTCEVDIEFKLKIENFDYNYDAVYCTNIHIGQCNFGMIKSKIIYDNKNYFNSLKNCNKETAIQHEGYFIRSISNKICYPNEEIIIDYCTPYDSNIRQLEYFKHVGLKKYKANWGQTQQNKNWVIGV